MSGGVSSQSRVLRLAVFVLVYSAFGIMIPIQGYVSIPFAVGTVITAILYALVLEPLSMSIPMTRARRFLVIWVAVYVIQMLNPILEGLFFSTQFEGHPELAVGGILFGTILTLPTALLASFLFGSGDSTRKFVDLSREYLAKRKQSQTGIRFAVAAVLWMVIYFIFGSIVAPIVMPYYTGGGVGYELVLPPVQVLLALQTLRGVIYVLGVMPLIMTSGFNWKQLAIALASLLYIGGAIAVFLISDQFPVILRAVHGVEMLADSVCAGLVISYLLCRPTQKLVVNPEQAQP